MPSIVQFAPPIGVYDFAAGQNPAQRSYSSNVTKGNTLVVYYVAVDPSATETLTIADNLNGGQTWLPIFAHFNYGDSYHAAWYCVANATGPCQVSVSGGSNAYQNGVVVIELPGAYTLDQVSAASDGSPATLVSNPITTLHANEVVMAFGAAANGFLGGNSGSVGAPLALATLSGWPFIANYSSSQIGFEFVSSIQIGLTASMGIGGNEGSLVLASLYAAPTTFSISGDAGGATDPGATVSYTGTASGSVTADGSGNYTIPGLVNGTYTITPTLAGYTFSPASRIETISGANLTGINFTATPIPPTPSGPSLTYAAPQPVQIFGRLPNGKIAAVAVDANGNLAVSGGAGGSLNSVDVIGNGVATPAMIYGVLPSGAVAAVAVDANGNLCSSGGGGGSLNNVDVLSNGGQARTVQIFGRAPNGKLVAVGVTASGALCGNINDGSSVNVVDVVPNGAPKPIMLCGRDPSGNIVAVALDATGALCITGAGGSSINSVDQYQNGAPMAIMICGRNPSGVIVAVPLDASGNLSLS
jgi:hypothetical protein